MLTREQLIKRLTLRTLAYFEASPYAKAKKIPSKEIKAAMEKLNSASTLESIRLLFLADFSYEVISISGNMGMGKSMPDEEAAAIAEKGFSRYVQGSGADPAAVDPNAAPVTDPTAIDVSPFAAPKKKRQRV